MARDRGAATAELVMTLPMLVVLTLALSWLVSLGVSQARLVDAARETARALARGEPEALAVQRGERSAPPGTTITVVRDGTTIRVDAAATVSPPFGVFELPLAEQHAEAMTEVEPCPQC